MVKNLPAMQWTQVQSLGWEDPLEKRMATHSIHQVQMWELDHKEGWVPKNWCFWILELEKTLESLGQQEIKPVTPKGNESYSFEWLMLKMKLQNFGHLMQTADSLEKTLILGKTEGRRRRGKQGERIGWHHRLNGHEFEQTSGDSEGQGSLVCCSPCSKELDTT